MRGLRWGWVLAAALLWGACGGLEEGEDGQGKELTQAPPGAAVQRTHALTPRWVRTGEPVQFRQVAVDGAGNVYVALQYFGPAALGGVALPWNGDAEDSHFGVAKFRPGGSLAWVQGYGPATPSSNPATAFYAHANAFAVTRGGTVYVGGDAQGGGVQLGAQRLPDGNFLLRLDASGQLRWARSTRPEPHTTFQLLSFAVRPGGGFYALASFRRFSESLAPRLMLLRYSSAGEPLWGNVYEQPTGGAVNPSRVASDEAGNAYVSGYVIGTASFGGPTGGGEMRPFVFSTTGSGRHRWTRFLRVGERGYADGLVARGGRVVVAQSAFPEGASLQGLSTGTGALRWRRALGDVGNGLGVATSARNEALLCVASGDAAALGVPRSLPTRSGWGTKAFVARFRRSDGRLLDARNLEVRDDDGSFLFADGCGLSDGGFAAVVGSFQGTADLGTGARVGSGDGFLLRAAP